MLVRDVLARKGDNTADVSPETTVAELVRLLAERNIGAAVVCHEDRVVTGIVSERDVVRALADNPEALLAGPVSAIMTRDPVTTTPGATVEELMGVMTERRIRHIPVIVDGRLGGIISIGDAVKSRMDQLESEREHLIGYISSGG